MEQPSCMWLTFTKPHLNTSAYKVTSCEQRLWAVLCVGWNHAVPCFRFDWQLFRMQRWTDGLQLPDVLFHLYQDVNILFIHFLHHTYICQSYTLFCVTVHLFIQFTFLLWYGMQQLKTEKASFGFDLRCIYDWLFDHELVCGFATVS